MTSPGLGPGFPFTGLAIEVTWPHPTQFSWVGTYETRIVYKGKFNTCNDLPGQIMDAARCIRYMNTRSALRRVAMYVEGYEGHCEKITG